MWPRLFRWTSFRHAAVLGLLLSVPGLMSIPGPLPVPAARADIYTVLPDGSGDFPTIQAAITYSSDGDVIILGNGIFTGQGNRDLNCGGRSITIRSGGMDPHLCQILCEGEAGDPHRGFRLLYQ